MSLDKVGNKRSYGGPWRTVRDTVSEYFAGQKQENN